MPAKPPQEKSDLLVGVGGSPANKKKFEEGQLRADLCAIAQRYSFNHGAKIIAAILKEYNVVRKPFVKAPVPAPKRVKGG